MKNAIILIFFLAIGCVAQAQEQTGTSGNSTDETKETVLAPDNITIAAFNIQVFGKSKASNEEVMEVLARTARNFDIIAVQEIRDSSGESLPQLVERINAMGEPGYNFTVGPRLGRTSSKEQYAYIYREGIELLGNSTFNDSGDLFHREPYMARFRAGDFDFVLITLHSDPDETPEELDSLPEVFREAREEYPEDDFILLGDLNADCNYLRPDDNISLRSDEYIWLVGDEADTTVKSTDCAYDRIIITNSTSAEYSGTWGIFRFDQEYGLNQSMAEDVSDHYPVFATFISSQGQEEPR